MQQLVSFPSGEVNLIFHGSINDILGFYDKANLVIITNEHLARLYPEYFKNYKTMILPAGEHTKDLQTIGTLTKELLQYEATRKSLLIGVGGGVITDITGFLASIYMRGVKFGFVPTTILGMVDASIGGKNGINMDLNKNILGSFSHPDFIIYDTQFLKTLPGEEWSNGFAEIIKYACLFDINLYNELSNNYVSYYKEDELELLSLIEKCVTMKIKVVSRDEKEAGERKLLNFGHTVGHAIENLYELPHGYAISLGMIIACMISEKITGLDRSVTEKLTGLLQQYYLPVQFSIDPKRVMEILKNDKKRNQDKVDFVLLEQIGKASIHSLPFDIIENTIIEYASNN